MAVFTANRLPCVDSGIVDTKEMADAPESNPYAVTEAPPVAGPADSPLGSVRTRHLNYECAIRAIGTLLAVGGVAGGVMILFGSRFGVRMESIALQAISAIVGVGLMRVRPWSRSAGLILMTIGLLVFSRRMLQVACLGVLLSPRGQQIFSDRQQEAIQNTPNVPYAMRVAGFCIGLVLLQAAVTFAWQALGF